MLLKQASRERCVCVCVGGGGGGGGGVWGCVKQFYQLRHLIRDKYADRLKAPVIANAHTVKMW